MSADAQKVEDLFTRALEVEGPAQREEYLRGACGGDPELFDHVRRLLEQHERAEEAIPTDPPTAHVTGHLSEGPGTMIGRYKLLQPLGEGGCGVVYMAEQEEPVRRKVALKIIKLGMDTWQVVARFEAERQALALMDHPNIAKVLDAGATGSAPLQSQIANHKSQIPLGRPYFVMELVRGIRITDYCDQNSLSTEERLGLFLQICQAVQHAHQKGIIHRDLKPSNILVTSHDGVPVPKVIDFGIAKATSGQRLTDKTLFTAFEQFMGTPAYMSPEQAELSGLDVDTRSDIYSLGVLLYELLTGRTPFDARKLMEAGLEEMRRTIREKEPARPSTRLKTLAEGDLTTVARQRQIEPPKLISLLRGDLDWIVMKALEKDRKRRYETANGLAMDIRRHLDHEPVLAVAPSAAYRFQKFARRNRVALTMVSVVTIALLAGTIISTGQAIRAWRAERTSRTEAIKSGQVARFLKDMLEGVGPSKAKGRDTAMLGEILDSTANRLGADLEGQPEVEAELRLIIGQTYHDLGRHTEARVMVEEALHLRESVFGHEHLAVAEVLNELGAMLYEQGDLRGAEVHGKEALRLRKLLRGLEHPEVAASLSNLGNVLQTDHDLDGAEALHREALEMRIRLLGEDHLDVAKTRNNLANDLFLRGDLATAEPLYRQALAVFLAELGADHRLSIVTSHNVGIVLARSGDLTGAELVQRQVLATRRRVLPPGHPELAVSLNELAMVLAAKGDLEGALSCVEEAALNPSLRPEHWRYSTTLNTQGIVLSKLGRWAEAEAKYREALLLRMKLLSPGNPAITETLNSLGMLLAARGELEQAAQTLRDTLQLKMEHLKPAHLEWIGTLWPLAWVLRQQGNATEADSLHREAVTLSQRGDAYSLWTLVSTIHELADLLQVQGRFTETEPLLLDASSYAERARGDQPVIWRRVIERWIRFYDAWERAEPGTGKRQKADEWRATTMEPQNEQP